MSLIKRSVFVFSVLVSIVVLAACGKSKDKAVKSLKAENSSLKAEVSSLKSGSESDNGTTDESEDDGATGVSVKGNTITTPKVTITITGTKVVRDESSDEECVVLLMDIKNKTNHDASPSVEWMNYVTLTQKTETSNVVLDQSEVSGKYEDEQEAADQDILAGKSVHGAKGFILKNKSKVTVKVTARDDPDKIFGTITVKLK
jgi:hypothetical protein